MELTSNRAAVSELILGRPLLHKKEVATGKPVEYNNLRKGGDHGTEEKCGLVPIGQCGVLYSALKKEKYAPVYRFSAVMKEPVDSEKLQRAVDRTMPRFPGFRVRIRKGAFWCYFEPNEKPGPFVKPDIANPCQPIREKQDNDWLIRFYYYENRISFEAFHAISDGAGALTFFRTILAEYLRGWRSHRIRPS